MDRPVFHDQDAYFASCLVRRDDGTPEMELLVRKWVFLPARLAQEGRKVLLREGSAEWELWVVEKVAGWSSGARDVSRWCAGHPRLHTNPR